MSKPPAGNSSDGPREERYSTAASTGTNPENTNGYNAGMAVFSYIIGGIVVWSLIGWGVDILLHTRWFVLVGAILGLAGGFYLSFARRFARTRTPDADGIHSPRDGKGTK